MTPVGMGFLDEIAKLAKKEEPPPSPLIDGLCEAFGKEKPRTPMQKAKERNEKFVQLAKQLNPQDALSESHPHMVHYDPGMTTPGI